MPNAIVTPIQRINIATDQRTRSGAVHSATQFIGASNPDISGAVANAAAAIILSQSAYNQANTAANTANTKVDRSGDTMTGTLNIRSDIIVSNNYLAGTLDAGYF